MSTILVDQAPEVVLATSTNNVLVAVPEINVVTNKDSSNVITYVTESYTPVSIGIQGPQGIQGDSDNYVMLLAGTNLGGHRAVTSSALGVVYATGTSSNVIGITTGSVLTGGIAQVQISGVLTEPSWNWALNLPIFVGDNGVLTQQVPSDGSLFIIGYPILATQIFIDKQAPILLG